MSKKLNVVWALLVSLLVPSFGFAQTNDIYDQYVEKILSGFPYPVEEIATETALERARSSTADQNVIVLVGTFESFTDIADLLVSDYGAGKKRSPTEILESVPSSDFASAIASLREAEDQRLQEYLKANPHLQVEPEALEHKSIAELDCSEPSDDPLATVLCGSEDFEDLVAEFENKLSAGPEVSSVALLDYDTARMIEKTYVVTLPTKDWTEAPAYLNWGNWNANPAPEYHVAALRMLRDKYDASLIAMTSDTIELAIASPVSGKKNATELAKVLYQYCPDLVDQGSGSVEALAAELLLSNRLVLWWD